MIRVQVESPYAARTPKLVLLCMHGYPCSALIGREGVQPCGNCQAVLERERVRRDERAKHAHYLRLCLRDSLDRGETPYASHALLTLSDVLRDDSPAERARGLEASHAMRRGMDLTAVYVDCYPADWLSPGMEAAESDAWDLIRKGGNHAIAFRRLGAAWRRPF